MTRTAMPNRLRISIRQSRLVAHAAVLLSAFLAGSACARLYPPPRQPDATRGYEFPSAVNLPNSDRVFLVLMFSGGGTRAAALSLGVLEQMVVDSVCVDGHGKSVVDEVDVISAVSGGAFPAAYFALHGAQGFPTFIERFLHAGTQTEIAVRSLMPEKLLHILASPQYGRSDVAAELWDDLLFEHRTLGDLARPGAPYVYINATDMDAGSVFSFTGDQLRAMCIAADTFPISRAVAASSAVPGALSPVTIRNHAAGNTCAPPPPVWTKTALQADPASERYRYAKALITYGDRNRQYVHLLDGGLADNIGARIPLRLLTTRQEQGSILDRLDGNATSTVLFVVVNASVAGDNKLGRNAESPSVPKALTRGADIALANTSLDVIKSLREEVSSINARRASRNVSVAEVAFRNHPDDSTRARLDRMTTSFQLPRQDVDLLRVAGRDLLRREPAYQGLLASYDMRKCR